MGGGGRIKAEKQGRESDSKKEPEKKRIRERAKGWGYVRKCARWIKQEMFCEISGRATCPFPLPTTPRLEIRQKGNLPQIHETSHPTGSLMQEHCKPTLTCVLKWRSGRFCMLRWSRQSACSVQFTFFCALSSFLFLTSLWSLPGCVLWLRL